MLLNILIINLAVASPQQGPSYRNHHLAEIWVQAGHRVTFVGTTFSHLLTDPVESNDSFIQLEVSGVRYVLINAPAYKGSGMGRVRNLVTGLWRIIRNIDAIAGNHIPDVVIAASVYQLDNFAAVKIATRFNAKFVRETRDLWPMTLIELGGYRKWHPFVMWVQWAEDYGYRHAALVVTTLPGSLEYMESRGLNPQRWAYFPQCPIPIRSGALETLPLPKLHASTIQAAKSAGKFIVVFAGSLVLLPDLGTLLKGAALLADEPVIFLIVGRGPSELDLRAQAGILKLRNISFLPSIPKSAVPVLLKACDAGIQGFADLGMYKYGVSPNKVFEYMQNQLPTILYGNAPGNPITASGGGLVVPPANPRLLADAVMELIRLSPEELRNMGMRAVKYVARNHNINQMAIQYVQQLETLRQ